MPPLSILANPIRDWSRNSLFANLARGFAKRSPLTSRMPIVLAASAAAIILMTAAGAFGTGGIPLGRRLMFWTMLIGINTLLWTAWLGWRVRSHRDWWPAVAIGTIVLNLLLPVEINLALAIVGGGAAHGWPMLWARGMAVSAGLLILVAVVLRRRRIPAAERFAKGRLWREGFRDPAEIAGIAAEDHYCRVTRRDGSSRLIHARFRDLAIEVDGLDGAVVRRGQWVAASAVAGIERDGRRWLLRTVAGDAVTISPSLVPALRQRGWIG